MTEKKLIILITLLFMTLPPALARSGSVKLPKTGQETCCYDNNGYVIECSVTGHDGDIQAGVEWLEQRFEDKGTALLPIILPD